MVDRLLGRHGSDQGHTDDPVSAVWAHVQEARNLKRPHTLDLLRDDLARWMTKDHADPAPSGVLAEGVPERDHAGIRRGAMEGHELQQVVAAHPLDRRCNGHEK